MARIIISELNNLVLNSKNYKESKNIKKELENYTEDTERKVIFRTKAEKRKSWEEL